MLKAFSWQAAVAGLLAAFVGFASSFPVVVKGMLQVGATQDQATSALMALSIAMGMAGLTLSVMTRMPVSVAWSTPGAALLATAQAPEGGFAVAVGAFIVTGMLLTLAGLWKPLGRAVAAIPSPIANAMLAGVLFNLCLAPVHAVAQSPLMALPVVIVWAVVARFKRLLAIPAALLVTVAAIGLAGDIPPDLFANALPYPVIIEPQFSLGSLIGIALPLFIVTMASQNIPGLAVLQANGYRPDAGPLLRIAGVFSLLSAPFGGHAVNLAAITAALCANPDAHPDPARRYWAAIVSGVVYVLFGLMAGLATAFISASPPLLIEAVAGLALISAFTAAVMGAVSDAEGREAAIVTFLVTASGLTLFGIGGAFWGLVAGGAMHALARVRTGKPS